MVAAFTGVARPDELAAHLPDKGGKRILQQILLRSYRSRISIGSAWKFVQISWCSGMTTRARSASAMRRMSLAVILSVMPRGFSPNEPNATSIR